MLILGGYLKVREYMYTQIIIWVGTILNHTDARVIFPIYEGSFLVYKPEWNWHKKTVKYPFPRWYHKK